MDRRILVLLASIVSFCGSVAARPYGILVNISENITSLAELGTFMTALVGIGITVILYILRRLPEIAIYVFIAAFVFAILYLVRRVFHKVGSFLDFGGIKGGLKS